MKFTYKITFNKTNWMRYISHLDLMRLFQRASRRAGFKLYISKGFNPHPVVRIFNALKLGLEGKSLEAEILLEENLRIDDFKQRLQNQLPEGIEIEKVSF